MSMYLYVGTVRTHGQVIRTECVFEREESVDPGEDVAGVYGLAFFGLEFFYGAGFWGFDFVLHFHGFDDEEALAGLDFVAGFDEETNHFAGHGGDDLLAAFGFDGAVFAAAPGARVGYFGFELVGAVLNGERAVGIWGDADFVGFAVEKDGEDAGADLDGVGVGCGAVERDLPAIGVAVESAAARSAGDEDFVPHGVRSSWARRPSSFQRESRCGSGVAFA